LRVVLQRGCDAPLDLLQIETTDRRERGGKPVQDRFGPHAAGRQGLEHVQGRAQLFQGLG
jgi:hypothetical protein